MYEFIRTNQSPSCVIDDYRRRNINVKHVDINNHAQVVQLAKKVHSIDELECWKLTFANNIYPIKVGLLEIRTSETKSVEVYCLDALYITLGETGLIDCKSIVIVPRLASYVYITMDDILSCRLPDETPRFKLHNVDIPNLTPYEFGWLLGSRMMRNIVRRPLRQGDFDINAMLNSRWYINIQDMLMYINFTGEYGIVVYRSCNKLHTMYIPYDYCESFAIAMSSNLNKWYNGRNKFNVLDIKSLNTPDELKSGLMDAVANLDSESEELRLLDYIIKNKMSLDDLNTIMDIRMLAKKL